MLKWSSLVETTENRTFGFGLVDQPNIGNPNDFNQTSSDFGR